MTMFWANWSRARRQAICLAVCIIGAVVYVQATYVITFQSYSGQEPLEVTISAAESERVLKMLREECLPAEYDQAARLILVPVAEKRRALMLLAKNNMLPVVSNGEFERVVEETVREKNRTAGRPVEDPRSEIAQHRLIGALQDEVARMIETIDGVANARVIYTAAERKPLFRAPFRMRAAVVVTMKDGREMTDQLAQTLIELVVFARSGQEREDVVVTDRAGRVFRYTPGPELSLVPEPMPAEMTAASTARSPSPAPLAPSAMLARLSSASVAETPRPSFALLPSVLATASVPLLAEPNASNQPSNAP